MNYLNVSDIRNEFIDLLYEESFVIDKSGVKTLEIINASFIADEKLIFGSINQDYIQRELEWYKSQSLNINDIPEPIPEIWKQIAAKDGSINSNYGWCVHSSANGYQYDQVYFELKRNKNSRRAIMIYNRPSMHGDYNKNGMSDFMCTNTVQYLIRNNKLNALVYMRSNDAIFGYKNDYAWQEYVLNRMCEDLNIEIGNIYWNVASLHIYERHFGLI